MQSVRVKVKQNDLRRLMKERRENVREKRQRIDSPLAKYNNNGKLYCTTCNVQIENEAFWPTHITGKIHKENIQKKKKSNVLLQKSSIVKSGEKRDADECLSSANKRKHESHDQQMDLCKQEAERFPVTSTKSTSFQEYSPTKDDAKLLENSSSNSLPKDFFDKSVDLSHSSTVADAKVIPTEQKEESNNTLLNSAESLPEGFFDNPVLDAKARNIEYKDPVEEEWERFQKTIAEETNFSRTIMEEDVVESTAERNIEQIDQQIHHWETVKFLQSKFEEECLKTVVKQPTEDLSDSGEEEQLEDLLDWRSKGVKS